MKTAYDTLQLIADRVRESVEVKNAILEDEVLLDLVQGAAIACIQSIECGGKIILFGNGGSAADAQHIAAELVGRYLRERRALPAIALPANTSAVTAIGNDYSFDDVFSRQLEAMGSKGDVAFGISTSGKSRNVIRALSTARAKGLVTIAMTGATGGALSSRVDYCLCVPSESTPRIQEAHILIGHSVCEIIEEHFAE
jgi:D-sedoheptulose 7-phosphate isomerase